MSEAKIRICPFCGAEMTEVETPMSKVIEDFTCAEKHFDWQAFRAEAAKDILCVLIGKYQNHSFGQPSTISLCEEAIGKADELVKQLKDG